MKADMHLNHINLPVPDVAASAGFLREYFCLTDLGPKATPAIALLTDDHGAIITLSNFNHAAKVDWPGAFHIGFVRDSRAAVDAVHARLTGAGHKASPPRLFHGSWTFYVEAPGGFTIEVQHFEGRA